MTNQELARQISAAESEVAHWFAEIERPDGYRTAAQNYSHAWSHLQDLLDEQKKRQTNPSR